MRTHGKGDGTGIHAEQTHGFQRVASSSVVGRLSAAAERAFMTRGWRSGRRARAAMVALLCVTTWGAAVHALPPDRVVYYAIHTNPTNPTSPVQYYLTLSISAQSQDGNDIGWQIDTYRVTEKATLGNDTAWEIELPDVDSPDGLWWVTHVDPNAPDRSDFLTIAPVAGRAVALDPNDNDLDIEVSAGTYTPPLEGDPWEVTTAITYAFAVAQQPPPSEPPPGDGGSDEPVDMPIPPMDPTNSSQ